MRHFSTWILLVASIFIIESWAMQDPSAYDWNEAALHGETNKDTGVGLTVDSWSESKKNQKKGLTKEERQERKEERQRNKETRIKKQERTKEEREEKALDKLRKQVEKKGKFPQQKAYLLWEQYLIDLDLQDELDHSEPEPYKDGFLKYVENWSEANNFSKSAVVTSVDKIWTRNLRGHNKKDSWLTKILQWSLKGECSAGSLTDEEQSLNTALKAWGEIDVSKDPQDARVETLTKIMALAKTAGLMNDDGKLCLCI